MRLDQRINVLAEDFAFAGQWDYLRHITPLQKAFLPDSWEITWRAFR